MTGAEQAVVEVALGVAAIGGVVALVFGLALLNEWLDRRNRAADPIAYARIAAGLRDLRGRGRL